MAEDPHHPMQHRFHEPYSDTNTVPTVQEHEARKKQEQQEQQQEDERGATPQKHGVKHEVESADDKLKREKQEMKDRLKPQGNLVMAFSFFSKSAHALS
jgi:hypothetical protein